MNIIIPKVIQKFLIVNFVYEALLTSTVLRILPSNQVYPIAFIIIVIAALIIGVDQLFAIVLFNIKSKNLLFIVKILQDYKFILGTLILSVFFYIVNYFEFFNHQMSDGDGLFAFILAIIILGTSLTMILFDFPIIYLRYQLNVEKYKNWYSGFGFEVLKLWGYRMIIVGTITIVTTLLLFFHTYLG